MDPEIVWLPLLIFGLKVGELTFSTIRTILMVSGQSVQAAILGFFEILLGVIAVGAAVTNLSNPLAVVAYAAGFSIGILMGSWVEERLALGWRVVQYVNTTVTLDVASALRAQGFRVTRLEGSGRSGSVEVGISLVRRRTVPELLHIITEAAPAAFVTVERAEQSVGGSFIADRPWWTILRRSHRS